MSQYERAYGTNWETLDKDEAIERAYALGVAASLGEYHPEELEAIRREMDTSYNKSVVDLAFEEGQTEALDVDPDPEEEGAVWNELVEGEPVTFDEDDALTGGRTGLPEAIDSIAALERGDVDSTDVVDLPEFLEGE